MPKLLVSSKRKFALLVQVVVLLGLLLGLELSLVGNFLPKVFWEGVINVLGASVVLSIIRTLVVSAYRKRNKLAVGDQDNFVLGINSLTTLATGFVIFTAVLFALDIPLQTFFASISLIAVALVLIFRDYISNYLDSFRLMFSNDYQLGNYVKVGENSRGFISDISFRATKLKTDEGDVLYIPNTKFITSEVVNYSKVKYKRITVPFSLPIDTVHPVEQLEAILREQLLTQYPEVVQDEKIFLRILNIKEWHTNFALEVSIDSFNFKTEDTIIKCIYSAVLQYQSSVPQSQLAGRSARYNE